MKQLLLSLTAIICIAGASAQNLNGTFESWRSYNSGFPAANLEAPFGWYGVDSAAAPLFAFFAPGKQYKKQIFKSTDFHSGAFAARIMSRFQDSSLPISVVPGGLSNAKFVITVGSGGNPNIDYNGGTAVNGKVVEVKAWIKHVPKSPDDSGWINVQAVRAAANGGGTTADTLIGTGDGFYAATPTYTQVTIPVIYDAAFSGIDPNKIVVSASSSDGTNPTDSTSFYIDDVTMTMWSNGVKEEIPLFQQQVVKCYPNPSTGILNLKSDSGEKLLWEAYTTDGKLLTSQSFTGSTSVDLRGNAAAQYFFMVKNSSGKVVQTGNFNLQ